MRPALLIFLLIAFGGFAHAANNNADDSSPKLETRDRLIVILGSFAEFKEAHTHALAISRASGMPFSMRGMIYDKKRGLILPDDDPDGMYAGSYILRRYNTTQLRKGSEEAEFISVERSDAYPGLKPGYYIIVGGIYDETSEAKKTLARFKSIVADGEVRKTRIYMGCMH